MTPREVVAAVLLCAGAAALVAAGWLGGPVVGLYVTGGVLVLLSLLLGMG